MTSTRQSGNVLLLVIGVVVCVGLVGLLGWRYFTVTDTMKNTDNAEQTHQTVTDLGSGDIIVGELPKGWEVQRELNVISARQIKPEGVSGCYVQVEKTADTKAKLNEADAYAKELYAARVKGAADQKGYTATELGVDDIKINVVEKPTITLPTHHARWSTSGYDGEYVFYQRNGYIVRDGYYFTVTQTCPEDDFATSATDKALSAFAIRL